MGFREAERLECVGNCAKDTVRWLQTFVWETSSSDQPERKTSKDLDASARGAQPTHGGLDFSFPRF